MTDFLGLKLYCFIIICGFSIAYVICMTKSDIFVVIDSLFCAALGFLSIVSMIDGPICSVFENIPEVIGFSTLIVICALRFYCSSIDTVTILQSVITCFAAIAVCSSASVALALFSWFCTFYAIANKINVSKKFTKTIFIAELSCATTVAMLKIYNLIHLSMRSEIMIQKSNFQIANYGVSYFSIIPNKIIAYILFKLDMDYSIAIVVFSSMSFMCWLVTMSWIFWRIFFHQNMIQKSRIVPAILYGFCAGVPFVTICLGNRSLMSWPWAASICNFPGMIFLFCLGGIACRVHNDIVSFDNVIRKDKNNIYLWR